MAGEECIFAIEHNRANAALDDVRVELDAAVVEESNEPVPVVQTIAEFVGKARLARDARQLLLEPGPRLSPESRGDVRSSATARLEAF